MLFILALLVLIIFVTNKQRSYDPASALSISTTQSIKGFFVITVFFSHFCSYVTLDKWYDTPMQAYCHWLGQLMVVPFFFYSGYGIFESVQKKGLPYIKSFPTKRILKTLFHFDLAVFLFVIYDVFFAPERLSAIKVFLSLFAWESIGNSNWFIFAIICAYLFCYLGLLLFKKNRFKAMLLTTILCLLYIAVISKIKDTYWVDSILAFPLGCAVSLWKKEILSKLDWKRWIFYSIISVLFLISAKKCLFPNYFLCSQIALVALSALILLLPMRISFNSPMLSYCGTYVFDIYILQRLPMNFGKYLHWNEQNVYIYFAFCLLSTLLIAILFHKLTNKLDSLVFKERT